MLGKDAPCMQEQGGNLTADLGSARVLLPHVPEVAAAAAVPEKNRPRPLRFEEGMAL